MTFQNARKTVAEYGRKLLARGLTEGTGGNLSLRTGHNIAISPSGVPYDDIETEDVPVVNAEGELVAGDTPPSSEYPMHQRIYAERDDVGAVVHTHSPYASTFAALGEAIQPSYYLLSYAGNEVPVAGFEMPGSEALGQEAADVLGTEYDACLLQNHGVITVGETLDDAFDVALYVEQSARIHYQAKAIGDPQVLSDEQMDDLVAYFEDR